MSGSITCVTTCLTKWCGLGDFHFPFCQIVQIPSEHTTGFWTELWKVQVRLSYNGILLQKLSIHTYQTQAGQHKPLIKAKALGPYATTGLHRSRFEASNLIMILGPTHNSCWAHVERWHHSLVLSLLVLFVNFCRLSARQSPWLPQ